MSAKTVLATSRPYIRLVCQEAICCACRMEHFMEVQELIFAVHPGMTDHLRTKLEDLLKSCQLSRTTYPAEQNDQPLQRPFGFNCRTCGRNGHTSLECFRSSYGNPSWVNQRFNNNSRNYNNDNFPNRK